VQVILFKVATQELRVPEASAHLWQSRRWLTSELPHSEGITERKNQIDFLFLFFSCDTWCRYPQGITIIFLKNITEWTCGCFVFVKHLEKI